jgi:hypothetical protein
MTSMHATNKPFNIDKRLACEAYKVVKSNRGAAGVDEQSIEQFDEDLAGNFRFRCGSHLLGRDLGYPSLGFSCPLPKMYSNRVFAHEAKGRTRVPITATRLALQEAACAAICGDPDC